MNIPDTTPETPTCPTCGVGYYLPSGKCDHCNAAETPTAGQDDIRKWATGECMKLKHGECRTLSCLIRGGYVLGTPCDSSVATCEPLELLTERDTLAVQLAQAKEAFGEHQDSDIDLAQRISELRDQVRGEFHSHTENLRLKEQLAQAQGEVARLKAGFPDIGPDPLKLPTVEWAEAATEDSTKKRLRDIYCKQQAGVPDQTALVWRIDLTRMMGKYVWRRAQGEQFQACMERRREQEAELATARAECERLRESERILASNLEFTEAELKMVRDETRDNAYKLTAARPFEQLMDELKAALDTPCECDRLRAENAELRAFAKDCRDNWDCDESNHKYGLPCRSCMAKQALAKHQPNSAFAENATLKAALTAISRNQSEKAGEEGLCPFGCDAPWIALSALGLWKDEAVAAWHSELAKH